MTFSKEAATVASLSRTSIAEIQKEFSCSTLPSQRDLGAHFNKESHEGKHSTNKGPWRHGKQRHWKRKSRQGGNRPRWIPRANQTNTFQSNQEGGIENANSSANVGPASKLMDVNAPPFHPQTHASRKLTASISDSDYPWAYGTPPPAMAFRIFPVCIPEEALYLQTIPNSFQVFFGTPNELHSVLCWDGIPPGAQGFCYAMAFASGQHFYLHPRDVSPVNPHD